MRYFRKLFICGALAITATSTAAEVKWDFASPYPSQSYHGVNARAFIKDIGEATGGAVKINHHANASLIALPEIKRAVQTGQIAIGEIMISAMENDNPLYGIDAVPFLTTNFDQAYYLWQASRDAIAEKLAQQGMTLLYGVTWPGQGLFTKEPIENLKNLRGKKMRIANPSTAAMAEMFGANGTTVEAADLAQATETGIVDVFFISASTGTDIIAWDFTTHYYDLNAWIPKNITYINTRMLESLPQKQQEAIMTAAAAAESRGWELAKIELREKQKVLCSNLKCPDTIPDQLLEELNKVGEALTDRWIKRAGDQGKKVIDRYRAIAAAMQ